MMIPSAWTMREKIIVGLFCFLLVLFGVFYLFGYQKKGEKQNLPAYSPVKEKKESEQEQVTHIMVDVKGAVKQPGIYRLPNESRVYQAIKAAGGLLPHADQKQINLAQKCQDEMVLYIPIIGEEPVGMETNMQSMTSEKVNINTATMEELEKLDSIGPAKAEAIVKYRETHGSFQSIDELTQVPGIGEKTLDKFRDQLTLH